MMSEKRSSQIRHNRIGQGYEFKFYSTRNRKLLKNFNQGNGMYDLCYF